MPSEEQKEVAINRYVALMRIKACETGENKELDYQIRVAKVNYPVLVLIIQNLIVSFV